MKNLFLLIALTLTSFIAICQPSHLEDTNNIDSTTKPYFYGIVNGEPCYCWKYAETKQIAQQITYANDCDSITGAMALEIRRLDSLKSAFELQAQHQKKMTGVLNNSNQVVSEMLNDCKKDNARLEEVKKIQEKKIKSLKFQRVFYPIVAIIAITTLFFAIK